MNETAPVQTARSRYKERPSNRLEHLLLQVEERARPARQDQQIVPARHKVDRRWSPSPLPPPRRIGLPPPPAPIRFENSHYRDRSRYDESPGSETPKRPPGSRTSSLEISQSLAEELDGICEPGQSTDLTVHLNMDIQENLDEEIEDFCHLCKIGSFVEARTFFEQNLAAHLDKPYVFVLYADMLFRQGSFREVCDLDARTMTSLPDGGENPYGGILRGFWSLIISTARDWTMKPMDTSRSETIHAVLRDLDRFISFTVDDDIGSIEIAIMSMIRRTLSGVAKPVPFLHRPLIGMDGILVQVIYDRLLREGRVWDMCGLLEYDDSDELSMSITDRRFPGSVERLINDWTSLGNQDSSTMLALLDYIMGELLMCLSKEYLDTGPEVEKALELTTPLAAWIAQNDPGKMKSRGYVKWIIGKAYSITIRDPAMSDLRKLLRSSPGVVFDDIIPRYIPIGSENPGWQRPRALGQVTNVLKLAINTARDMEDYETEALALKFLISITDNPEAEFMELCELENRIRGDIPSYMNSLISSYLWSTSDESKSRLKENIAEVLLSPDPGRLPSTTEWMANMLFYALEKEGPRAEKAIVAADDCLQHLSDYSMAQIEHKIPDIQQQANRRNPIRGSRSHIDDTGENQEAMNQKKTKMVVEQAKLDERQTDADAGREQQQNLEATPNELRVILAPTFSDRKKIKLSIENTDDPKDKREITYQRDPPEQSSSHLQGYEPAPEAAQLPPAIELKLRKDGTEFEKEIYHSSVLSSDTDELKPRARAQPIPTASHHSPAMQHCQPRRQIEMPERWKAATNVHSHYHLPIDYSDDESVSDPPLEQTLRDHFVHKGDSNFINTEDNPGRLDEDPFVECLEEPSDEDESSRPAFPKRQSRDNSNTRTQIAKGDGHEGTIQESLASHEADSVRGKHDLSRDASIEPVSRRSTMPTVEDSGDNDNDDERQRG